MDSASLNSQVPEFRFRSSEPAEDEIRSESTSGAGSGGGNAAHLSSGAKYRLMSPAKLPISRPAGGITVPPGLSPTSFLESPVLLSNMKVEPSPTTGSFGTHRILHGPVGSPTNMRTPNSSSGNGSTEGWPSYFEFKQPSRVNLVPSVTNAPAEVDPEKLNQKEHFQSENQSIEGSTSLLVTENLSDDGYNWRKYGQKLVKGSEFPRSYYKCTHPNCEVKKLFERSPEGRITEIIYKGTHDHPKPQPGRRFATGMVMPIQEEKSEKVSSSTADKSSNMYGQSSCNIEPNGTLDLSPVAGNEDSIEGIGSSSKTIHDEADEDDFLSKRRRLDVGALDVTPVVKPIREPRVVVQTLSEVDILDDGYRWRKYGQKVVRGNPNPRSYYKCTNAGCPVRKHVERASHDPKAVITTYEGKHNHDVPVGKNNASDTASQAASPGISCIRPEEVETVSLDLEVGISSSSAAENNSRSTEQQIPHSMHQQEFAQNQARLSSSGFQVLQANSFPSYYGRAGAYGLIENINGSRGVAEAPPLSHSSFQYPQNMGRVLTGP